MQLPLLGMCAGYESIGKKEYINWQVNSFTEIILNIMSNFILNKIIKVVPKDHLWINQRLKNKLNKQKRLFRNYKRNGFKPEDKRRVDDFREECNSEILLAKETYLSNLGSKLSDSSTAKNKLLEV